MATTNTNSIDIYGASDDLIEIEGAVREEFSAYGTDESDESDGHHLAISDGSLLKVWYDSEGVWRFHVIATGQGSKIELVETDDNTEKYRLTAGRPIKWVLKGKDLAK